MIVPVIHRKPERGIFNLVCQPAVTFQNLRNRILVPFFHSPEPDITGIFPCSGVRNIENIADFLVTTCIVKQCNSGRTALNVPSNALVPCFKIRAGGRVGTLSVDHELFMVWIFVQPCRRCQKRLPVFGAVSEKFFCPRRKLRESLVFSRHLCPPIL